jgi:hypothetical protein
MSYGFYNDKNNRVSAKHYAHSFPIHFSGARVGQRTVGSKPVSGYQGHVAG